MGADKVKIISLVPSWTETLLAAGVNVVGRTRFCIHPDHIVKNIPAVGGTKSLDIKKLKDINPDYILVDKQENTKEMAEQVGAAAFKLLVTDVTDFKSVTESLSYLGQKLKNDQLNKMADRYRAVVSGPKKIDPQSFFLNSFLKGNLADFTKAKNFAYVIWKNPFMVVGESTFIAQNFKLIGIEFGVSEKYPEIADDVLKEKFCFFSSEPYPFLKDYHGLLKQGFKGVVVDGEKLSWYGIRNLKFLEACLK